jgi:hypothetical protein
MAGLALAASAQDGPAKAPVKQTAGTFGLHYQLLDLSGNRGQAARYLRPRTEFGIDINRLGLFSQGGYRMLDVDAVNLASESSRGDLALWGHRVPWRVRAHAEQWRFVADPGQANPTVATRRALDYDALIRPTGWLALRAGYRSATNNLGVFSRGGLLKYAASDANGGLDVKTKYGTFGLEMSSLDYRDRATGQPSALTLQYGLNYDVVLGSRLALGADARWARIKPTAGQAASDLFTVGASGLFQVSNHLAVEGAWRFRDLQLGPTLNGYVGKHSSGSATITYRPARGLSLRAGAEQSGFQRYNALQTAVDKPSETRAWARADYRGQRGLRLSAAYQLRSLDGLKASVVPGLTDALPLFQDSEQRCDLRASRMVGRTSLLYGFYQWRQLRSDARDLDHIVGTTGVGLSGALARRVQYSTDLYYRYATSGQTALAGLGADTFVLHAGLGWAPQNDLRLAADYHRVSTFYGQSADEDYVAASCTWQATKEAALAVTYHREGYEGSALPTLSYDADVFKVTFTNKF